MFDWLDRIGAANNAAEVLIIVGGELDRRGVVMRSYRFVNSYIPSVEHQLAVDERGYPPDWVKLYLDPAFRANDPVQDFVLRSGRTMTWQQALDAQKLSPAQQQFAQAMAEHGIVHGIGCPLFGPNGREAYTTFSFGRAIKPDDRNLVRHLVTIAQAGHRRIASLSERKEEDRPRLSGRENEVLTWMARGKSTPDIAAIIGCAPGTAETYVKRIYSKLKVNDRSSAIIVALRNGLIKI